MFILPVPRACDKLSAHRGYIACAWSAPEVSVFSIDHDGQGMRPIVFTLLPQSMLAPKRARTAAAAASSSSSSQPANAAATKLTLCTAACRTTPPPYLRPRSPASATTF